MHAILVSSRLLGDAALLQFRQLLQEARRLCRSGELSGALLFDGERGLHLLQGPMAAVQLAVDNLYQNSGHSDLRVLAELHADNTTPQPARLRRDWCAGYADPEALDAVCSVAEQGDALATIATFGSLLRNTDCH